MKLPFALKSLGQNFLIDQKIIHLIVTNFEKKADAILEIGPGPGILTSSLAQLKKPFKVIEKDYRFENELKKHLCPDSIYLENALQVDLEDFFKKSNWTNKKIWLVSNLPYNIATPLLVKFLQCPSIKYMTLMFQREVANRIIAIDSLKKKSICSLMALCQNYFEITLLKTVPPGAFRPSPKIESAVLSFQRKPSPLISLNQFSSYEKFLRTLFQFKRKNIENNLKTIFPKDKIYRALSSFELSSRLRPQSLHIKEVQLLYKELLKP